MLGCQPSKLPTTYYNQFSIGYSHSITDGQLEIKLSNPLYSPLRIRMLNNDETVQTVLDQFNPILLKSKSDTIFTIPEVTSLESNVRFSSLLGDLTKEVKEITMALPFPKGKTYRIIQGNDTRGTHSNDWSRYAVDFSLQINDTIGAATDGYVVGVIDQYELGGKGDKWKRFGNFITLYDPNSGIYTQYVHLVHKGSLVKVGDKVSVGQAIGLSGLTGQTDIEHLHFSALIPVDSNAGLKSTPIQFVEGYKSQDFKRHDRVKH